MKRSLQPEIMDSEEISAEEIAQVYREIQKVNRWLGNTAAILRRLQATTMRPLRILDIGCGHGGLLLQIRDHMALKYSGAHHFGVKAPNVEVLGIDLRSAPPDSQVPILTGNAVTDSLPAADIAICVLLAHHLSESDLAGMIVNVSRSCQRFLILDLVRHPVPLWLFRLFVAPFLNRINASDGQTSIRRAYTAAELGRIVQQATTGGRPIQSLRHTVALFWTRQIVEIHWQ
ncbi:MAG TPA: hypothetical protein VHZ52_10870 [Acidobacteriaceae bacterium]|jgi:SAM-dependent methyltransferase|nr:hypothetical protein [Acidobacteriaceae bacterium]